MQEDGGGGTPHLQLVGVAAVGRGDLCLFRLDLGLMQRQRAALLGQPQHVLKALRGHKVDGRLDARLQVAHLHSLRSFFSVNCKAWEWQTAQRTPVCSVMNTVQDAEANMQK